MTTTATLSNSTSAGILSKDGHSTPNNLVVSPATGSDLPAIMKFLLPSFWHIAHESQIYGREPDNGIQLATDRHIAAWNRHRETYPDVVEPIAIKCSITVEDEISGQMKTEIAGFAEWFIHDRRMGDGVEPPVNYLMDVDTLPAEVQEIARPWLQPVVDCRARILKGRPHAVLMYMAVDPRFRRKGVSTLCVKWGMRRCDELGVPGFLEASEEGKKVYERLGWEVVEDVVCGPGETFPAMMYWPEGVERWN